MTSEANIIDYNGQDAWSIRQYGTANAGSDIQFDFQRLLNALDTVGLGSQGLGNNDLVEVNVTIRFVVNGILLTATNNTTQTITYGENDVAELFPRFTGGSRTWTTTLNTADDEDGLNAISVDDFAFLTTLSLDGVTLDASEFASQPDDQDLIQNRTVHPDYWGVYLGDAADKIFRVNNDIFAGSAIGASGFIATQEVQSQSWFAEVEYIVIPEPGTIALMAIALGGAGGMAFLRRRKRS